MEEKNKNLTDEQLSQQLRKSKGGKWGGTFLSLLGGVVVFAGIVQGGNLVLIIAGVVILALEPARRYSNPEDHRAAGLCRPQNCRIKQKSPGGCRGSLSLSCICWLL